MSTKIDPTKLHHALMNRANVEEMIGAPRKAETLRRHASALESLDPVYEQKGLRRAAIVKDARRALCRAECRLGGEVTS